VAPQTLRLCQMVRTGARPHAPAGVCGACSANLMRHLGLVRPHVRAVRRTSCSACLGERAVRLLPARNILHTGCGGPCGVLGLRLRSRCPHRGPPARTEPSCARSWSSTRSGKRR